MVIEIAAERVMTRSRCHVVGGRAAAAGRGSRRWRAWIASVAEPLTEPPFSAG